MKDLLGNDVKIGDVMITLTGWGSLDGSAFNRHYCVWEVPKIIDGSGIHYTVDGKKTTFYWANVSDSIKVKKSDTPKDFMFSFRHGMGRLSSKVESNSVKEILINSNYNEVRVKKSEVDRYNALLNLNIKSIQDIKNNIELLKSKGYIPNKVVCDVLRVVDIEKTPVHNGEIGIAGMYDMFKYSYALKQT